MVFTYVVRTVFVPRYRLFRNPLSRPSKLPFSQSYLLAYFKSVIKTSKGFKEEMKLFQKRTGFNTSLIVSKVRTASYKNDFQYKFHALIDLKRKMLSFFKPSEFLFGQIQC